MTDFDSLYEERKEQEKRLEDAGIEHDGGGIGLGGWDIFIYETDDPDEDAIILSSVEDVDRYIAEHGAAAQGLM